MTSKAIYSIHPLTRLLLAIIRPVDIDSKRFRPLTTIAIVWVCSQLMSLNVSYTRSNTGSSLTFLSWQARLDSIPLIWKSNKSPLHWSRCNLHLPANCVPNIHSSPLHRQNFKRIFPRFKSHATTSNPKAQRLNKRVNCIQPANNLNYNGPVSWTKIINRIWIGKLKRQCSLLILIFWQCARKF